VRRSVAGCFFDSRASGHRHAALSRQRVRTTQMGRLMTYFFTRSAITAMFVAAPLTIEGIATIMAVYLTVSLSISVFINWYDRRIALKER
jgi:hypothetical protein